jgi:Txe/YoeB family toxin of Txe-Axe toxin-antitoxin module
MDTVFKKEAMIIFDWVIGGKKEEDKLEMNTQKEEIFASYLETPLTKMQKIEKLSAKEVTHRISKDLRLIYEVL